MSLSLHVDLDRGVLAHPLPEHFVSCVPGLLHRRPGSRVPGSVGEGGHIDAGCARDGALPPHDDALRRGLSQRHAHLSREGSGGGRGRPRVRERERKIGAEQGGARAQGGRNSMPQRGGGGARDVRNRPDDKFRTSADPLPWPLASLPGVAAPRHPASRPTPNRLAVVRTQPPIPASAALHA